MPAGLAKWRGAVHSADTRRDGTEDTRSLLLRTRLAAKPVDGGKRTLFLPRLSTAQRVIVGGREVTSDAAPNGRGIPVTLDPSIVSKTDLLILVPQDGSAALAALQDIGSNDSNVAYLRTVPPA